MKKIIVIEIAAKEWFDRINGNSYFSADVTITYDDMTEESFIIPFEYGYGDSYINVAFKEIAKRGILPDIAFHWRSYCHDNGIKVVRYKRTGCKKKELHK